MILLFDQNLSPRLVRRLSDVYIGSLHVEALHLERATDRELWDYARSIDAILVTKDSDFSDLAVLEGSPPKVIWLRVGNCTTDAIEKLLRRNRELILDFAANREQSVLELV